MYVETCTAGRQIAVRTSKKGSPAGPFCAFRLFVAFFVVTYLVIFPHLCARRLHSVLPLSSCQSIVAVIVCVYLVHILPTWMAFPEIGRSVFIPISLALARWLAGPPIWMERERGVILGRFFPSSGYGLCGTVLVHTHTHYRMALLLWSLDRESTSIPLFASPLPTSSSSSVGSNGRPQHVYIADKRTTTTEARPRTATTAARWRWRSVEMGLGLLLLLLLLHIYPHIHPPAVAGFFFFFFLFLSLNPQRAATNIQQKWTCPRAGGRPPPFPLPSNHAWP